MAQRLRGNEIQAFMRKKTFFEGGGDVTSTLPTKESRFLEGGLCLYFNFILLPPPANEQEKSKFD